MSSEHRLVDYLDDMVDAARQACAYVDGLDKTGFIADRRTQQAVILNLVILGEAATRVLARHADFVVLHPQVPWHNMRGMMVINSCPNPCSLQSFPSAANTSGGVGNTWKGATNQIPNAKTTCTATTIRIADEVAVWFGSNTLATSFIGRWYR